MAIQVKQITGDIVELIFNPREDDLRVGENLSVVEREGRRGLIVQIIEFRTVSYPSLVIEQLHLALEGAPPSLSAIASPLPPAPRGDELFPGTGEAKNLKLAIAKIRKLTDPAWHQWDGWIPMRDVVAGKTSDREVFENCIPDLGNPLRLGRTLAGEEFCIEGRTLEKVNIITGVKGSGKSHLAKVILLELVAHQAPCVVFDINREYIHLPAHDFDPVTGEVRRHGILHLLAGGNLKLSIQQFGLSPLVTMLTKFGLPEVSALYFENRVARLLDDLKRRSGPSHPLPFLGIEDLIQMARNLEFAGSEVVNGAILSRLEAIKNTGVFATHAGEALSIREQYEQIRGGGALVIDLSALSNLARIGFVQAIIEIIKDVCEAEIAQGSNRFPFVFFEEAHLYINRNTIGYIVTRARHLGITSFFVTNMIGGLDETVLRQADNLFILRLPFDDDVRHLGKSALTDQETMNSFVRRLRNHHSLLLGDATRQYPIIFQVDPLDGVNTAGETQYFFRARVPGEGFANTTAALLTHSSQPTSVALPGDTNLPLFPEEGLMPAAPPRLSGIGRPPDTSPSNAPFVSLARVIAVWEHVVRRLGRRRRILETILAYARPVRIFEQTLVVGFPPQHRFHQELLDSPEYRTLLEAEISRTFGVPLQVMTAIQAERRDPRPKG
ncbi:MAG: DUF87 domain-containing protein [Nitrospinae bacterium]|nr:DUF87 domain-containing protein [Nitrospinota bacterium]